MAITPEQLRNTAAIRNELVTRKHCHYQDTKLFVDAIASKPMPTLSGLLAAGYMANSTIKGVYFQYMALTCTSKWRRANIDRVYKMIHG
jgi:hypothetical protein